MTDEKARRAIGPIQRALAQWLEVSGTVPKEHTQLLGQLDRTTGDISGYKFNIGQAVVFLPQCNRVAPGQYVVTGLLPQRDGEFEYCIYNEGEPYQRVAKESELRQGISPAVCPAAFEPLASVALIESAGHFPPGSIAHGTGVMRSRQQFLPLAFHTFCKAVWSLGRQAYSVG
jgi:hypothetical protein